MNIKSLIAIKALLGSTNAQASMTSQVSDEFQFIVKIDDQVRSVTSLEGSTSFTYKDPKNGASIKITAAQSGSVTLNWKSEGRTWSYTSE